MAKRQLPAGMENPPEAQSSFAEKMIVETREYKLITPLFGGGVEPNTPDPVTIIRATEIRGHLRFWWRATRGGQFKSVAQLKQAEDLIWGTASKKGYERPSLIQIDVICDDNKKIDKISTIGREKFGSIRSPINYADFPLRDKDAELVQQIEFKVSFQYPSKLPEHYTSILKFNVDIKSELHSALKAWEYLGGLGARTRRGFGSILCKTYQPSIRDIKEYLSQFMNIEQKCTILEGITSLNLQSNSFCILTEGSFNKYLTSEEKYPVTGFTPSLNMWKFLLDILKEFRHDRSLVRKNISGGTKLIPGRNNWPEPDALREITKQKADYTDTYGNIHDHTNPNIHLDGRSLMKFPRAVFGLPIIFQFKDNGDPPQITLKAHGSNRWASPIILRVIKCTDGVIGLVLRLRQPEIDSETLELDKYPTMQIEHTLEAQEAVLIPRLNGNTDVLDAFMNYVRSKQ